MTGDADLLRVLAAADDQHPPAPGRDLSPATLHAAARGQRRRQFAAGAVVTAAVVALCCAAWPTRRAAGDGEPELAALRVQLAAAERLATAWYERTTAAALADERARRAAEAATSLRWALADARADAAQTPRIPVPETPR